MRPVIFALVCVLGLSVTPETIVLIPPGAESKEHGPHLQLRNDLTLAECDDPGVVHSNPDRRVRHCLLTALRARPLPDARRRLGHDLARVSDVARDAVIQVLRPRAFHC